MSFKDKVQNELNSLKSWASEKELQAKLASSEASAELRKLWMETEQNAAKLEARLEDLGAEAEVEAEALLQKLKENWDRLKEK